MNIINNTAVIFTPIRDKLITHVFYKKSSTYSINKSLTYRTEHTERLDLDHQTHIFIHDLNEFLIRESHLEVKSQQYKATNILGFIQYVKNQFKTNKPLPQTTAHYSFQKINPYEMITVALKNLSATQINLEPPPWIISQHHNFEIINIVPELETLNFYPQSQTIKAIFSYLIHSQADILINYGATHESNQH